MIMCLHVQYNMCLKSLILVSIRSNTILPLQLMNQWRSHIKIIKKSDRPFEWTVIFLLCCHCPGAPKHWLHFHACMYMFYFFYSIFTISLLELPGNQMWSLGNLCGTHAHLVVAVVVSLKYSLSIPFQLMFWPTCTFCSSFILIMCNYWWHKFLPSFVGS